MSLRGRESTPRLRTPSFSEFGEQESPFLTSSATILTIGRTGQSHLTEMPPPGTGAGSPRSDACSSAPRVSARPGLRPQTRSPRRTGLASVLLSSPGTKEATGCSRGAGNVCRREKRRQGFHLGSAGMKPFVSLDTCVPSARAASSRGKDQTSGGPHH